MSATAAERTHLLDALRGFALFGMVFSNYTILAFCAFLSPEQKGRITSFLL